MLPYTILYFYIAIVKPDKINYHYLLTLNIILEYTLMFKYFLDSLLLYLITWSLIAPA